jgi:hypothetical protein
VGNNYYYSSYHVLDASYVRLKNIQLGYTFRFPKAGIDRLRVMFSGENVFTLTKYWVWDPETPLLNAWGSYPIPATYSLGVNITF